MSSSCGNSEIVESKEDLVPNYDGSSALSFKLKGDGRDSKSLDDHRRFIKAVDVRTPSCVMNPFRQISANVGQNNSMKKPAAVGIPHAPGIGISQSATLKQALRRLCISQASEMAALKRPSKSISVSGVSEAGTIKRLYASVVVQPNDSGLQLDDGRENLVAISLDTEKNTIDSCEKGTELCQAHSSESSNNIVVSSPHCTVSTKGGVPKASVKHASISASTGTSRNSSVAAEKRKKGKAVIKTSVSGSQTVQLVKLSIRPCLVKPVFRNKTFAKKKGKRESTSSAPSSSSKCGEVYRVGSVPIKSKENSSFPASSNTNQNGEAGKENKGSGLSKPDSTSNSCNSGRSISEKMTESSRSREKGECSQSSKSSIGDYSSSTSISEESHQSGSSGTGSRPHMSKDVRWTAVRHVGKQHGNIGLQNFKLLKKLGCGDIGTVYLAELIGSECLFALKVMDIEYLVSRKKMLRAQTEREILQMLDHPFLPTLYTHFATDNLSCLVMEYCPGGDLHVLRQKQIGRCFSELTARFYVAEALLALEYLHMLGVVYRDLKPENILVRDDGHIMLSDFDLSLRCTVRPSLVRSSSENSQVEAAKKPSGPCAENSCIDPLCIQPSCFTPRRKPKPDVVSPFPQLVVEPTDARSNSFVGTHEYLAPEIIRGDGHGSAVDWWTFGIFLYELLFGRTPFKGCGNEETLGNVVSQSLKFPESRGVSFHARDLIRGLLCKEPENRLGCVMGAAEIKQHPFFEGLNWALIRCAAPPRNLGSPSGMRKKKDGQHLGGFELF